MACLLRLDARAAFALVPYLLYRVYAVWWGYALWRANRSPGPAILSTRMRRIGIESGARSCGPVAPAEGGTSYRPWTTCAITTTKYMPTNMRTPRTASAATMAKPPSIDITASATCLTAPRLIANCSTLV